MSDPICTNCGNRGDQMTWEEIFRVLNRADSELSAYAHGRPLDKDVAQNVSDRLRAVVKALRGDGKHPLDFG